MTSEWPTPASVASACDPGAAAEVGDLRSDAVRWLGPLAARGPAHDEATRELHGLLLRASRFEVHRRAGALGMGGDPELDDLATQAAGDALVAVMARLDSFEGRSRFTTWAYKFAINTAGVAVRRHAWRDRGLRAPEAALERLADLSQSPGAAVQVREQLREIAVALPKLTAHQRTVLLTLAVEGVPIDVLAERLSTNRNALYKTLHDARKRLRQLSEPTEVTP